ncbi:MAG TPA: integrase arm-type DNA-binding domain-containing protein [Methylocella sp.]|nr:integrase arm-type DNA-binding domain-containing protein [Methylocella sp.]
MAIIGRLPKTYKNLKPGLHGDGGGLYLQVTITKAGNRSLSWIHRYQLAGRIRNAGLGPVSDVSLADAREQARLNRLMLRNGIDPLEDRNAKRAANLAASVKAMTFDEASEIFIRQHRAAWKNPKHAEQWVSTLKAYASPVIGKLSVSAIETAHVMKVLEPIWLEKPETASRVRGRLESILGWATVSGYRQGDNPARWRDHLKNLLPAKEKVRAVRHQTALPYAEVPSFLAELRARQGMAALALEFGILTCVRTADVRNARHADIDRVNRVWIIREFSKTHKEHRVPLSDAALAAFDKARALANGISGKIGKSEFAFPNDITGARLSENALLSVIDRMGFKGQATAHGFRASFRTWALEQTSFPWELCEMSLGHTVGNKVEIAYQRGDGFQKRVAIMNSWAAFCARPVDDAKVLPLAAKLR